MATKDLNEYERAFIARVRAARRQRFKAQEDLCEVLEIEQDAYKWYETERLIPHDLIGRFCLSTGVSIDWLITGKGAGPAVEPLPERRKRRKPREKKVAA